jgi:DNA-binding helix-turn-helix protein|nr:MAG TPA: helix-turn-helix domain protein [Caudoviricetes sp.]
MKYDKQEIGQRIRAERKARKMSQEELSKAVGIARSTLIHVEKGGTLPELTPLTNICEVLGCRVSYILGEEEEIKQIKFHIGALRMSLALQSEVLNDESEKLHQIQKRIEDLANMSRNALKMCDEVMVEL